MRSFREDLWQRDNRPTAVELPSQVSTVVFHLRVMTAFATATSVRQGRTKEQPHAHPDHFNGLSYVVGDDVPVYATKAVADTIAAFAEPKRDQWQPVFGDQWPDRYRVPDHQIADGAVVAVAGLRVWVHDLGAGESHADSYLVVDDAAFIGDLAFAGTHSYLADGDSVAWLRTLDRLTEELRGLRLCPGHGAPGGVELVDDQRRYVLMYREAARRLAKGAPMLTDDQKHELTAVMTRFLGRASGVAGSTRCRPGGHGTGWRDSRRLIARNQMERVAFRGPG